MVYNGGMSTAAERAAEDVMTPIVWTREAPRRPGWYWCRVTAGQLVRPVEPVLVVQKILPGDVTLIGQRAYSANGWRRQVNDRLDKRTFALNTYPAKCVEWGGPIEPPVSP